jgi:hypothetical protein
MAMTVRLLQLQTHQNHMAHYLVITMLSAVVSTLGRHRLSLLEMEYILVGILYMNGFLM